MKDTIINLHAHHDANGDKWLEACFTNIPCGCKIVGNGLLSAPLNIKFCAKHAALAAPEPDDTPKPKSPYDLTPAEAESLQRIYRELHSK